MYFRLDRGLGVPLDALTIGLGEVVPVGLGDPVSLDFGDEEGVERVFTGSVAEIRARTAGVEIFALGALLALVHLRVSRHYLQSSAGHIARDLLGQAGTPVGHIEEGAVFPAFAVDRRQGAFPQLKALADRLDFHLFSDRMGRIHFRNLGPGAEAGTNAHAIPAQGEGSAAGILLHGRDILEARGIRTALPARRITVGGDSPMSAGGEDQWSWLSAQEAGFQGSSGEGAELILADPLARTQELASRFAAARRNALRLRQRRLHVTMAGRADLELGDQLETGKAAMADLNGRGLVQALRHRFDTEAGFVTEADLWMEAGA